MELIQKFKNYLLSQKNAPSKATVKNYLADIHHFISWVEEQYHKAFVPQDVTIQIIEAFKEAKKPVLSQSSIDRHISSLRKFFVFLKLDGQIGHSPFEEAPSAQEMQAKTDPWHLHDFKNYLYVYNASHLTIKNYLIDVKQFLIWAEQVLGTKDTFMASEKDVLKRIDTSLVEEYKTRLIEQHVFSATSINRKLSSLRKYLSWAAEQGLLTQEIDLGLRVHDAGINTAKSTKEDMVEATDSRFKIQDSGRGGTTGEPAGVPGLSVSEGSHRSGVRSDRTPGFWTSQNDESQPQKYSKIPPVRLFQKTVKASTFVLDLLISRPIAHLLSTAEHKKWELQGKPLFVTAPISLLSQSKRFIPHVKNISKDLYAPLSISTAHLPWYRKALHHIRYTRPTWYRRYHQMALAHYFNWAVLIIFSTAIGFGMYASFMQKPTKSLAALPNGPLRVLSFQGRLTDANDNPITTPTDVRFMIYNNATATGSAEQWEEVDQVTPDSDGIFSLLLGSNGSGGQAPVCSTTPATGPCGIPQSLFANNNALWLGVTVGNTAELTPREQIATVAFASNAETLQGLPPITQSGAGTQNVVLALNSAGNLAIGASTTFQSTSGQFAISGNTLALNTNAGTNGNITFSPDGLGFVDIQKPIQNSTNNNNISTAAGAVEIDDTFAVLATSSGQSAFTLNQNGTGPLISASTSGTAKFTVDNGGNTYATAFYPGSGSTYVINSGTSNLNSLTLASNLTVSGNVTSDLVPSIKDTYNLGGPNNEWLSLYAQNIYSNGQLLANFWQRNNGVVSPLNITDDLAVGGTATSSAKFQVFGNTGNATTSGNLTFTGTGSLIQTANNQMLTIGGNTTGNITLAPLNGTGILYVNGAAETVGNGADYTIQTTGNSALSLLSSGSGNITLGQNAGTGTVLVQPNAGGQAAFIINKQGTAGDILTASSSGNTQFTVSQAGGVYGRAFYDLDNASYFLDPASVNTSLAVAGSVGIGTSSVLPSIGLDIQQYSPNAADLLVNQLATGQDIFTASASGTPKFTVAYNGNLTATGTVTGLTGITSSGTIDFTGLTTNGVLQTSGGNGTLTVAAVNLGTEVSGTLPLANGGTGNALTANSGGIVYSDVSGLQILAHATNVGQCLVSGGSNPPSWATCSTGGSGTNWWAVNNGSVYPINSTLDLFVGGTATSSAKFAVLNMSSGTPTASISATATGTGLALGGDGSIQSLINSPLTLGGNTTGTIILAPQNGTGTVSIHGTALDTNAATFALLGSASTINIGAVAGTINFQGSSLDATQSTVNLLNTPGTINLGGYAHTLNIQTNTVVGTSSANTLTVNSQINSDIIPYTVSGNTSSYSLGDPNHMWQNIYAANIYAPTTGGTNGFWSLANNVIYPANYTADDLAIGGSATSSAQFQVFAQTVGTTAAGTASTSGNLVFHGTSAAINLLNGNGLNINESAGGDSGLSSIVTISNSGDLSLNGNLTVTGGNIYSTAVTNNIFTGSAGTINLGKSATNVYIPGSVNLGSGSTNILTITGTIESNLNPTTDNAYAIGNTTNQWSAVYAHNLILPATGGIDGYWTLSNQVLSPTNNSDLAIGGAATSSAKFQIFANSINGEPAGTASTSGQLTFTTSSQMNLLNNAGLGFYNSVGGDTGITTANPALFISNAGHIGIGTNNPSTAQLLIAQASDANIGAGTGYALNINSGTNTILKIGENSTTGALLQSDSSLPLLLNANGNSVGIGTTAPLVATGLDIEKNALGNAAAVVNQLGAGDVFTASSSGTPKFTIANDGSIKNSLVPNLVGATGNDTLYNLGSTTAEWDTLYVRQIVTPSNGGLAGFWQLSSAGVLAPANLSNDLALGGTATSSAVFQVFGSSYNNGTSTIPAGTATTSGQLTFRGSSQINILNGGNLGFYPSVGGDSGINTSNPALYISNSGNIGIGTNAPSVKFEIDQNAANTYMYQRNTAAASTTNTTVIDQQLNTSTTERTALEFNSSFNNTTDASRNSLVLFKTANAGIFQSSLAINGGNIGIGSNFSNPQGILDVASNPTNLPSDLTLAQTSGTNLIPNPSFEIGTTGWSVNQGGTGGTIAQSSTTSIFGSKSILITTGTAYTAACANISVSSNTTYTLSAWVKTSVANNARAEIYDMQTASATYSNYHTGDGTWQRLTTTLTTGASTTNALACVNTAGAQNSTAYADGFQLEQSPTASPYIDGSLGPGYYWTGAPNNSSSVRQPGSAFAYNTINSAQGIGAASLSQFPTLQLDQNGTGDLMTASASGVTQFRETNTGALYTRSFYDLDNPSYYLDPASTATSLTTAGSVGIGTTAPLFPLHIVANGATSGLTTAAGRGMAITAGTAGYDRLYFEAINATSGQRVFAIDNGNTSGVLSFSSLNDAGSAFVSQNILNMTSSGNVGIGTNTPGYSLVNAGATTLLGAASGSSTSPVRTSTNLLLYDYGSTNWSGIGSNTGGDMYFVTGTSAPATRMTVLAGGNVGIGTTSPANILEVAKGASYTEAIGSANNPSLLLMNTNSSNFNEKAELQFSVGNDTVGPTAVISDLYTSWTSPGGSSGNVGSDLAFYTKTSTTALAEAMRITGAGNVGIGTTTPATKLQVVDSSGGAAGSINFSASTNTAYTSFISMDNTGLKIGENSSTRDLELQQNGSTKIRLNTGGGLDVFVQSTGAYFLCKFGSGTNTLTTVTECSGAAQGDFTENVYAPTTEPGDVVQLDPNAPDQSKTALYWRTSYAQKATAPYAKNLFGIMSTWGFGLELPQGVKDAQSYHKMATSGVVPTKISLINGPIHIGDPITASEIPGVGMKATEAGQIVGRAVENFDGSTATQAARLVNGSWQVTNGACQTGEQNCYNEGKILTLVNVSWYDPQVYMTTTGDLQIAAATPSANFSVPTYYTLNDALGNPISRMGAYMELAVANLRAGSIQTQQTITNTLAVATDNVSIAGQSLADYILSVVKNAGINTIAVSQNNQIQTNIISPLASGSAIAIRLNNSRVEIAKDATGSAVASIDNQGNATFSGTLNAENLAVNGDATVSGTLHANRIEANTIEGLAAVVSTLSAQNVTIINNNYTATPAASPTVTATATGSGNLSSTTSGSLTQTATTSSYLTSNVQNLSSGFANIASFSGYLSYVPSLQATTGLFEQGLVSFGPTSLSDTSIQGQLSIGSQLILADNSLNVLGSDFAIQPLRQGGVNFEGGLVAINTNGDLTVGGNAIFNKNIAINTLSPIPGHDLQINLSNGAATGSAQPSLKINNASGSAVFAINQMGDLMASGAANISKLNFNLVQPAMAVSDTEVVATGSAGTATIKAFQKEVTIDDKNVTDKSLIYITPVGTDQTPYLERQVAGTSFTVGIPIGTPSDVNFNWLIVN